MSKNIVRQKDFGKDIGLVHEMIVTGRKVGAGSDFYAALAHDEKLFRRVVEMVLQEVERPSFAYDAVHLLGFGPASTEPLPDPAPGEIVIRVGDWSLPELRDSDIGRQLMHQQDWYEQYENCNVKLTPGIYRVRLPVPDSNRKNSTEQKELLLPDEEFARVALGASVMVCHLKKTGQDLLNGDWCRCIEPLPDDRRVELRVREGRVRVSDGWGGDRDGNLWLAAARPA